MSFLDNKKLLFFNDKGEDLNFALENGVYKGTLYLPKISTYLINKINLFVFEEFEESPSGDIVYGQPQDENGQPEETIFRFEFSDKEDLRWNFYSFQEQGELKIFQESPTQFESTDPNNQTIGFNNGRAVTIDVDPDSIKIKGAFSSGEEGSFRNTLRMFAIDPNTENEELILDVDVYTEVVEEDQRLGTLINNFYKDIEVNQQDFFIFRDTDIKEGYPDWTIINSKLKELLLNGKFLKNYQGSYRGLITAIRYFGYDSLRIKEYFENVDPDSKDFGKNKLKEIKDQFDGVIDPFYIDSEPLPNKIWKKTAQFGLFYDLNKVVDGEFDEYGLPIVEDAFDFTNEEILIKLQGLKEKLKSKFLPLSARIVSITGEGTYFTKYDINTWSDLNISDKVNVGREASFDVYPGDHGFIINLNELLIELDSIVRQDEQLVVPTQEIRFYNTALNNIIPLPNTAVKIENVTVNGNDFFINGVDYILDVTGDNIEWISQSFVLSNNDEIIISYTYSALDIPIQDWNPNPTIPYNQLKNEIINKTIVLDSKYTQTFIDFIRNKNEDITTYADDEDTPVGCPTTLSNTTFALSWDDTQIDWDLADEGINGSMSTWDTIKYGSFYEIEWTIVKRITTDSPQSWEYDLRGSVIDFEEINLIIPYSGTYDINMRLYNTFNSSTSQNFVLNVEQKNGNVVVNHKAFRTDFTWDQRTQSWDNTQFTWAVNLAGDLTWDQATTSYNSVDKAQYGNARLYNSLYNFTLNDVGNARWSELDHLWWDGTEDAVLYNPYTWEMWGSKTWNSFYKNESWDGKIVPSDSPAFFEIYDIQPGASITIGKRVPATFETIVNNPVTGPQTVINDLKYIYTRLSGSNYPKVEGNLLSITDTQGNTLLTFSRDSQNKITHLNGNPVTRANKIFIEKVYTGLNVLLNEPPADEILEVFKNGELQEEGIDYNLTGPNSLLFNSITVGEQIEVTYYSQEIKVKRFDETTVFSSAPSGSVFNITDTSFYNNLNVGQEIILHVPTANGVSQIYRTVAQKLTSPDRIVYSGTRRSTATKLVNPALIFNEIINNTDKPLTDESWRNINSALAEFEANIDSFETERQILDVEGDTLTFSGGVTDLESAYSELIFSELAEFKNFNFNIIYEEDETTVNRIQGVSKLFGENRQRWIKYDNAQGEIFAPALTLNYNWNELRVFETRQVIPQFSQLIFSYDNAPMPGKQLIADWELTEVESGTLYTLSENVFSHFFNRRGEYILKLLLTDSNGNQKECVKQGIVLVE